MAETYSYISQVSLAMATNFRRRSKVTFEITEGQRGDQAVNVQTV